MELFAITDHGQMVAGGVVMEGLPLEMAAFEDELMPFIKKGYLYIGFLFVVPEYRGQQIGSKWLGHIGKFYGGKGFWLTVEEPGLVAFYEKNGFKWKATLSKGGGNEELLVLEPAEHSDR